MASARKSKRGPSLSFREPRSKILSLLTFACLGKRLRVTVLRKQD